MNTNFSPKISIILPTFNGASKYLKASIDSCLRQTYQNIELIVVDDCSTDQTPEVVRSYHDPRLIYIRNQTNQRLPRSLNIGFAASTGEYLTWTSDDNEFLPNAIEEMLALLQSSKGVEFVYTDMIVRYFETGAEEIRKLSDLNLEKENNVGACYLYTRKVYETVGDYNPRFEWVEDYDYWIRVAKKFSVRHLVKPLYIYGDHVQSLTSMRRYPIVMMRDILRYWHGYLSLKDFLETIRQFSADVRTHIEGRDKQAQAFKQTFEKAFGISFFFGVFFLALFGYLFLKKGLNALIKPLIAPFKKMAEQRDFERICSSLKATPQGINVLCVIPEMVLGGSEKVVWDIVKGLTPQGYNFHLICNRKDDNAWCRKFKDSFKNVVLLKEQAEDLEYDRYLQAMVRKLDVKLLLNSNSRVAYRCLPKLKSVFPELKAVDILHVEFFGGTIEKYAWVANHLEQRICISHHLKNYMKEIYRKHGIVDKLSEKLEVIHNGTDTKPLDEVAQLKGKFRALHKISSEDKIITFIGRIAPGKNPFLFVEIAKLLVELSPNKPWKFVMAGGGPYTAKINARINEYNLQEHFILTGILTDVAPLLADTFLLVVTSENEGIPLVVQEALEFNAPVLSSNVGAVHELVKDGVNGYLITLDEHAAGEFAKKAIALASDQGLYNSMKSEAKTFLYPEFSLNQMHRRYKETFHEVLALKIGPGGAQ